SIRVDPRKHCHGLHKCARRRTNIAASFDESGQCHPDIFVTLRKQGAGTCMAINHTSIQSELSRNPCDGLPLNNFALDLLALWVKAKCTATTRMPFPRSSHRVSSMSKSKWWRISVRKLMTRRQCQ